MRYLSALCTVCVLCGSAMNSLAQAREFPPKGEAIPPAERTALAQGVKELGAAIAGIGKAELVADLEIFHKAVDWPLRFDEPLDVKTARRALEMGMERVGQLRDGKTPWVTEGGVRAYVSRIDGSVQPYFVVMPQKYDPAAKRKYRLDFFFHGRDERLTELKFMLGKRPEAPTFPTDENRFLVYTYGRYCNANKFAGEIDTLEVLEAMKKQYPIDEDRVLITGFSMGGAAVWHHAVHYTDLWAAASPGAGFAETRVYQKMDDGGEWAGLAEWQKKLQGWYDCTEWAGNLAMLPTVAYAGELDKQRQSGDLMEKAMEKEGLTLERVWGPKTEHKYEAGAMKEIVARLDAYAERGRNTFPKELRFTTYTLRYNRMHWITVEALERHWERATVRASIGPDDAINMTTTNVRAVSIRVPPGRGAVAKPPLDTGSIRVTVDGNGLACPVTADGSVNVYIERHAQRWSGVTREPPVHGVKRHGLQGPIDDAFLDSFLIVKPSRPGLSAKLEEWTKQELYHASTEWRKIFRGEPREKNDHEVTDADIAGHNLILFGDPSSNYVIARIAKSLPITWTREDAATATRAYPGASHAVVMIYPNPLNPSRYVVLNSGFTFRQADHRTNSRQLPKLPDYAVIDLGTPADDKWPGKVVEAGFFDEGWGLGK